MVKIIVVSSRDLENFPFAGLIGEAKDLWILPQKGVSVPKSLTEPAGGRSLFLAGPFKDSEGVVDRFAAMVGAVHAQCLKKGRTVVALVDFADPVRICSAISKRKSPFKFDRVSSGVASFVFTA